MMIAAASLCLPAAWAAGGDAASGAGRSYRGPAVAIGRGSARTVVQTDAAGRPTALGVEFTAGALDGLPASPHPRDSALDWHYYLAFAKKAPATGFDHVMLNWHPKGHVPKGIYDLAHFDFHFYLITRNDQLKIHYPHPETADMTGVTLPDKALVPVGYFIPPGTQVDRMGVHAVEKAAPEFSGKKFTSTLIYGYSKGELAFIEPMQTIAYLQTRPNAMAPVAAPARYSFPGYYPATYSVTYDASRRTYAVMFGQLKPWEPGKLGGPAASH